METYDPKSPLMVGLAVVGGLGLTLMSVALGVGVIQGAAATSNLISGTFWVGLIMLVGATIGWFGVAQPYKHFDDINEPHYHGHHEDH